MKARTRLLALMLLASFAAAMSAVAAEKARVTSGPQGGNATLLLELTDQPALVVEAWDILGGFEVRKSSIDEDYVGFPDLQHSPFNDLYEEAEGPNRVRFFRKQSLQSNWSFDTYGSYVVGQMSFTMEKNNVDQRVAGPATMNMVESSASGTSMSWSNVGTTPWEFRLRPTASPKGYMLMTHWWAEEHLVLPGTFVTHSGGTEVIDLYCVTPNSMFLDQAPLYLGVDSSNFMVTGFYPPAFGPRNHISEWTETKLTINSNQVRSLSGTLNYTLEMSLEDTFEDVSARLTADRSAASIERVPWLTVRAVEFGAARITDRPLWPDSSELWLYAFRDDFATDGYYYEEFGQVRFSVPEELRHPTAVYRGRVIEYFYADSAYAPTVTKIHELEMKEGHWQSAPISPASPPEDGATILQYFSVMAEAIQPHPILPRLSGDAATDTAPNEYLSSRPVVVPEDVVSAGVGSRSIVKGSLTLQQVHLGDSLDSLDELDYYFPNAVATWSTVSGATAEIRLWRWTDDGSTLGTWTLVSPTENLALYFGSSTEYFFAEALTGGRATLRLTVNIGGTEVHDDLEIKTASVELAVDMNRDGAIKFSTDDDSDATSSMEPFRFWLNDDTDREHSVDGNDSEEDDIGGAEATGLQADWKSNIIVSKRDLEDFARILVSTSGLTGAFKPKNGTDQAEADLYLGFQWADTTGSPGVKIYPHVETDGGTQYLTDTATADAQIGLDYAMKDFRDTAAPATSGGNLVTGSDFLVIAPRYFGGLSDAQPKTFFLFEGVTAGKGQLKLVVLRKENGSYTKIGDGPGVWMDLKNIRDMYEHWSVGNYNGGPLDSLQQASSFGYTAQSPEEAKYILFVHGWNMEQWEKERFAETAYKRLYWQNYKGRFGLFSWPTTHGFEGPKSAVLDGTNYDRGEFVAWSAAPTLKQLFVQLNGQYPNQLYVVAHSMGNVVAGEALRLATLAGTGQVVNTYVATQAALPAHCYDGVRASDVDPDFAGVPIGHRFDGTVVWQTPNIYGDWLRTNGGAASARINIYNVNDYALWHDVWELNQIFKPDSPDFPDQRFKYGFTGDPATANPNNFTRYYDMITTPLALGDRANVQSRYEIMSFAAESRSKAVGATASNLTLGDAIDLQTIWPDDTGLLGADGQKWGAHKWHSAQFRSTNMRQGNYWKTLLGTRGFNLPTTP